MNTIAGLTRPSWPARLGSHLWRRMLSGIFALFPLVVTIFVLRFFIDILSGFTPIEDDHFGEKYQWLVSLIRLLLPLAVIYLVGLLTSFFVGRKLFSFGERLLLRLPIIKTLYASSKQIVDAFSLGGKRSFEAVVMVEYPRRGIRTIGFITGHLQGPANEVLAAVFIPTTPNPTSGYLALFPVADVHVTGISVEDGIKLIVSGGMLLPEALKVTPHNLNVVV